MPHPTGGPTGGTVVYRNPLRHARVIPERVDQGVDYSGEGPIYAIGPGEIVSTKNSGWPGGAFIVVRLDNGHYWYAAEQIQPVVQVGQRVDSSTVIGYFAPAGGGIETGWAAPPPNLGAALAGIAGQFGGSNATAYGAAANNVLVTLGAPSGTGPQPYAGTAPAWAWNLPGSGYDTGRSGRFGGGPGGPNPAGCLNTMVVLAYWLAVMISMAVGLR